MTLAEIKTGLANLTKTVGELAAKFGADAVASFKADLQSLQDTVNTKLSTADASVEKARQFCFAVLGGESLGTTDSLLDSAKTKFLEMKGNLEKAQNEANSSGQKLANVNTKLNEALAAMKLSDVKADAAPEEKIAAMQNAVATTLEKLGVDAGKLPGAPAASAKGGGTAESSLADKVMARVKAKAISKN